VDLSEHIEKLKARERAADDWVRRFSELIAPPAEHPPMSQQHQPPSSRQPRLVDQMVHVRRVMETDYSRLHELASEGSRVPVEVEAVSWLQVELDGRNWSVKTRKWIPGADDSRKGRLEDLQEHLSKAVAMRDRLSNFLSPEEKDRWSLDGEAALRSVVEAAERWHNENRDVLEGDNRKSRTRPRLSIPNLRRIVDEGNSIYVNLGSAGAKMSRILVQAESWLDTHRPILARCNAGDKVEVAELLSAVTAANNDVSVDLEEAQQLADLTERVKEWFEAAELACGNRKNNRSKKGLTIEKLMEIIEDSATLPVDTEDHQRQLSEQLRAVQEWRDRATSALEQIRLAYNNLHASLRDAYGPPSEFSSALRKSEGSPSADTNRPIEVGKGGDDVTVSSASSESETIARFNSDETGVLALSSSFLKESQSVAIRTPEGDCAVALDAVSRWLAKSVKYLESHRDVFDKRFFGAFDRFLGEGRELVASVSCQTPASGASALLAQLNDAWRSVVSDQMERLGAILKERERYTSWCEAANVAIEERKLSMDKLRDLSRQSLSFPIVCDTIAKVQSLEKRTQTWAEMAGEQLSSGSKLSQHDAKSLLDEGEKFGIMTSELRALRAAVKAANGWATRVKRCKPESGKADSKIIQDLLDEHESLLIEMPEEAKRLKKAVKAYCICRRPYDGFMVGCDSCDDWFHGPCIGVNESKAGKVDKYVCVRCQLTKVYESSAATCAAVIKKWTSVAELRKARQSDMQKYQRKLRKEIKDIEKLSERRDRIREEIQKAKAQLPAASPSIVTSVQAALSLGDADPPREVSSGAATSDDPESTTPASEPAEASGGPPISIEDMESTLVAVEKSLAQCETRRAGVNETLALRRNEEEIEDASSDLLRQFAVVVRSIVLVPATKELAEAGRPLSDGSLSPPMQAIVEESQAAGLLRFQDVQEVLNTFECMTWCLRAKSVMSRQPQFEDVQALVRHASSSKVRLPSESALRVLRGLTQRATGWQIRVMKAIAPSPGEVRPFDIDQLRDLSKAGDDIPLNMSFQARLAATIDDKGVRHCICGGPSDGRLMLSCDACDRWFHSQCVGLSREASADLDEWKCPECSGVAVGVSQNGFEEFHNQYDCPDESSDTDDESSSLGSGAEELWPPYGLLGSEKAEVAIGKEASEAPPLLHIQVPVGAEASTEEIRPQSEPQAYSKPAESNQVSAPTSSPPGYHPMSYSQAHPYFAGSLAPGPYVPMSHGLSSPGHYAPPRTSVGTPPRAPPAPTATSSPPVVFGSPGLTVLSSSGLGGGGVPHPHATMYAAAAASPPASMFVAGVPHPSYAHYHPFATASLPPHALFPPLGYPAAVSSAAVAPPPPPPLPHALAPTVSSPPASVASASAAAPAGSLPAAPEALPPTAAPKGDPPAEAAALPAAAAKPSSSTASPLSRSPEPPAPSTAAGGAASS
jgi:hypothetical protein